MRLGIDVDDVVAELLPAWLERLNKLYGTTYTEDKLTQWEFEKDLGLSKEEVWACLTPDIYDDVQPCPGALEVINALRARGHEVVFITSCHDLETWLAKFAWLQKFGFLTHGTQQAFPTGPWANYKSKREVGVHHGIQWLVDDSIENCEDWSGHALLLTRPHNRNLIWAGKRLRKFADLLHEVKYAGVAMNDNQAVDARDRADALGGVYPGKLPIQQLMGMPCASDPSMPTDTIGLYRDKRLVGAVTGLQTLEIKPEPVDLEIESGMKVYQEEMQRRAGDSKPTNPKDGLGVNKVPLHLVSGLVKAYASIAHYLGNVKYGAWNYRACGARASVYVSALQRHIDRWWEGEEFDQADGTPHLANALACINILIECQHRKNLIDDRPPSTDLNQVYVDMEATMQKIRARYPDRSPRHYTIGDKV